ncbi:serine/threonine-protein kinase [Marinicella meishanensis]|uniref:serine/threonine-protein kinase n=1 Tax=Marinicella meishanensis TaxID=2873263 RepID=UPI001CBCB7D8|nr:serine/threonine-protein kinase [Marinicella sp. NBU2979]
MKDLKLIDVEQWQLADQAYAQLIDLTVSEAIQRLHEMTDLDDEVKSKVLTLIINGDQSSQYFNQHVSSGFDFSQHIKREYQIGDQVGGYVLLEEIGTGGMAKVYKAIKTKSKSQKAVAIKIFNHPYLSGVLLDRFGVEQKILSSLSHPHIVNMRHSGRTDHGVPYTVMELIEGGADIDEHVRSNPTSLQQIVRWMLDAARAIAYAHSNLVIHRDIKPSNLLIDKNMQLKIVDFGIAKLMSKVNATQHSTIMALTPTYASPEQINSDHITVSTDVFSLAAVCLGLISGQEPLPKDRLLKSCATDEIFISRGLKKHVTNKDLRNILNKALQKNPLDRYASMESFADDLSAWLTHKPVRATGHSWFYVVTKFAKRRRALFTTLMISMATLIFMLFVLSRQNRLVNHERQKAVEINDFMLDLFASADPGKNSNGKLKAVDLLHMANKQIANRYQQNPETKAELLTIIGSAFISLGSVNDGEQLLLNSLEVNPNNIDAQLKLIEHYIDSSQLEESTVLINQLEALKLSTDSIEKLNLDLLKAYSYLIKENFSESIALAQATQKQFILSGNTQGMVRSTEILSSALSSLNQPQAAIDTILKITGQIEQTQIMDSLGYIKLKELLSVLYRKSGELQLSLQVANEAILYIERFLGLNHPLFITAAIEKARTLSVMEQYDHALMTAQQAYDVAAKMYGDRSKLTQHAMYGRVFIYEHKGALGPAIKTQQQVVELSMENYGVHHFITINGQIGLAKLMFHNNQHEQAIKYILELKDQWVELFGGANEHVIYATNMYIDFMYQRNQTESVLELIKHNHQLAVNNLAKGHPQISYANNLLNKISRNE